MTEKGLNLIAEFEGLPKKNPLDAYWDKYGKVWTIGYGATHYLDGTPVKKGDKLKSKEEAMELLRAMTKQYEDAVYQLVTHPINMYQADALTSFSYNCGIGNLKKSTLLKKVNKDSFDPTIRDEFAKWNKSGGVVLSGLTRRRKAEADLYFTPCNIMPEGEEDETDMNEISIDKPTPKPEPEPIPVEPEPTPDPEPVVNTETPRPRVCHLRSWFNQRVK